ncbi:glycoside hydrolase family 5 protein [Henriciella sp. AS95]|uniref:glycoside hydrolase family 5 protein n=1 Tax=Henriciella sp. AS95 TaxID=3135782 RepID=UPI0031770EC8
MRYLAIAAALMIAACSPGVQVANAESASVKASPVQRCVNLGGSLEGPSEGEWGYTVRRADFKRIKEAGFDTIRLPVKWSGHTAKDKPYTIDPDFMARVKEIADWAIEADLQIIIDVHHFDALMERPEAQRPRLGAIWRQISEAFEGAPDNVIFELINEPRDKMTVRKTDSVNRELLAIIREKHPDRWVIVGSAGWGSLEALLKSRPPKDDRIILTFHNYDPYDFTHQGAFFANPPPPTGTRWGTRDDISRMKLGAKQARVFALEQGHPMFVGEFGVYEDVPLEQRAKWTRAFRETAEENGFGWCHWDFATTFKIYNQDRETWIHSMLGALIDE